jgi:citrate synthase
MVRFNAPVFDFHSDHESGNVSALTTLWVLHYPIRITLWQQIEWLAGPLHGLANQECLKFVLSLKIILATSFR